MDDLIEVVRRDFVARVELELARLLVSAKADGWWPAYGWYWISTVPADRTPLRAARWDLCVGVSVALSGQPPRAEHGAVVLAIPPWSDEVEAAIQLVLAREANRG